MTASIRIFAFRVIGLAVLMASAAPAAGAAQIRISPGPLVRAHAALEGILNCSKCHGAGHALAAEKCLACHKPIAQRIARKSGVHRAAGSDCNQCHREHRGVDADLRHIDTSAFDHLAETGFAIENLHAKLATKCQSCHKARTFLDARPACSTCHNDPHKSALGIECTRCHSTDATFKSARLRFDHERAQFQLTGAHRQVACEKCHVSGVFRGLHFNVCSACHKAPHRNELGPSCTSCHVTDAWTTKTIEHARTGFVLIGEHIHVACAKCHTAGVKNPLRSDRCSACHVNVHRDSVKDDCRKCHTEAGFKGARFDHGAVTGFPLIGRHEPLACRKCHTNITTEEVPLARKVIDFSGLKPGCVSCHTDQHKGEYGRVCDACHRPDTFKSAGFKHPRSPDFFAGRHTGVACVKCHVRPSEDVTARADVPALAQRARNPAMACSGCHADPHLGQVGTSCDRCHAVDAAKFSPTKFRHESTKFPLSGQHLVIACVKCHAVETRAFPAGAGSAKHLSPMPLACNSCHKDPHLGQADQRCATCHTASSFKLLTYAHHGMEDFFGGFHGRLPCKSCHKTETGQFPAGRGTAMRLKVGKTCASCHPY